MRTFHLQKFCLLSCILWIFGILACSESMTRPETADKLKPILVVINAPAAGETYKPPLPASAVHLDFHFIGPTDLGAVSLSPVEPKPVPLTLPISDWSLAAGTIDDEHPGLRHLTIRANATLPTAEQLATAWPPFLTEGFVRLRYTLVADDGQRQIPIAGDFLVYRDLTVSGAGDTLTGSIDSPVAGQVLANDSLSISSSIVSQQDEPVKIGWFVSAGEIKNRRALNTEWQLPGSGAYTLILTVRGKNSRTSEIQFRHVVLP